MNDIPPNEIWSLDTMQLGQRVDVHDRLDSTNTLALSLALDPSHHGLVVLAREQNAGRGQYGRSWHAPADSSVLMSLLLFPPPELRRPALLTAWAAVSVCEAVATLTGLDATLKWPNDVLVHRKKICGILIEQRTTGIAEFPLASVIGIGLNVTQSASMFEQAQLPDAGSLAMFAEETITSEDVARALILGLDAHYASLLAGNIATLESLWKWRLGLLGKTVLVEGIQNNLRGRLLNVAMDGIEIEVGGEVLRVTPESVKHIYAD